VTTPRATTKADVVTRDLLDERTCRIMHIIGSAKELEVERHAAIDAKLSAASMVLEERLHHLNELRGDVITKKEYTAQHDGLAKEFHNAVDMFQSQIAALKEWKAEQRGKASQSSVLGAYIVGVVGWIVGPLIALAIERIVSP
jgi:hypothetical protein